MNVQFNSFNWLILFEIFNQLLFQHRSSRDGTIGLDDKEESGRGKGKAVEYRGGKNGGGEWRVGWNVNASWDGSLLPVSGKCMAIVATSLPLLDSPPEKFPLHRGDAVHTNPEKSPSKFSLLCANNNNTIHGVSRVFEALGGYFCNFLSSFIFSSFTSRMFFLICK